MLTANNIHIHSVQSICVQCTLHNVQSELYGLYVQCFYSPEAAGKVPSLTRQYFWGRRGKEMLFVSNNCVDICWLDREVPGDLPTVLIAVSIVVTYLTQFFI